MAPKTSSSSRWLAADPSKRWTEVFFLAYSPFWILWALCLLVPLQLFEVTPTRRAAQRARSPARCAVEAASAEKPPRPCMPVSFLNRAALRQLGLPAHRPLCKHTDLHNTVHPPMQGVSSNPPAQRQLLLAGHCRASEVVQVACSGWRPGAHVNLPRRLVGVCVPGVASAIAWGQPPQRAASHGVSWRGACVCVCRQG